MFGALPVRLRLPVQIELWTYVLWSVDRYCTQLLLFVGAQTASAVLVPHPQLTALTSRKCCVSADTVMDALHRSRDATDKVCHLLVFAAVYCSTTKARRPRMPALQPFVTGNVRVSTVSQGCSAAAHSLLLTHELPIRSEHIRTIKVTCVHNLVVVAAATALPVVASSPRMGVSALRLVQLRSQGHKHCLRAGTGRYAGGCRQEPLARHDERHFSMLREVL